MPDEKIVRSITATQRTLPLVTMQRIPVQGEVRGGAIPPAMQMVPVLPQQKPQQAPQQTAPATPVDKKQ